MGAIANTSGNFMAISIVFLMVIVAIAGGLLTYFINQKKKNHADSRSTNPASETQRKIVVAGTAPKENFSKTAHSHPPVHDNDHNKIETKNIRDTGKHSELRQAIRNLKALPAIPIIAQKLLALNLNTEEGERMLLVLISQEPQISAKIIGLANSAFIGASRRIISIRDAALLLGAKRVQAVAASIAILSLMAKAPQGMFRARDLWLHGFRVAAAVQSIARFMPVELRPSDEQIFLAGTLHDIGYLVLAYLDPKLSDKLHSRLSSESMRSAMDIEYEMLGICHDELGAELARHWNLPDEIISALRYHHYPEKSPEGTGQILAHMIDIAQKLLLPATAIEITAAVIDFKNWAQLGIPSIKEEEVKEQIIIRAEQATQFVNSIL